MAERKNSSVTEYEIVSLSETYVAGLAFRTTDLETYPGLGNAGVDLDNATVELYIAIKL